jgi:hypothetical protein
MKGKSPQGRNRGEAININFLAKILFKYVGYVGFLSFELNTGLGLISQKIGLT